MLTVTQTSIPGLPVRRGKVRDIYTLPKGRLLIVSTDRISTYDWVHPTPIPGKGWILNNLSAWWFNHLGLPNHLITTELPTNMLPDGTDISTLAGRTMQVVKTQPLPVECIVRGYLAGSGWTQYQTRGTICGIPLPPNLVECQKLPEPLFTPSTKAETGHDISISFQTLIEILQGVTHESKAARRLAYRLRHQSINAYQIGARLAEAQGIIIADTKFEWGLLPGSESVVERAILIDELLTPDSSRFWPADQYQPGHSQLSFDKQFVRDYAQSTGWDKDSPAPALPDAIVAQTRTKYIEAYERLTGNTFLDQ